MSLAPQVGLEPTTLRLTAECSTIELLRSNGGHSYYTIPQFCLSIIPQAAAASRMVRMRRLLSRTVLAAALLLGLRLNAADSGADVFKKRCASCHDSGDSRIPASSALSSYTAARILRTLESGTMMPVASSLTVEERAAVAAFLGKPGAEPPPPANAFCRDRAIRLAASNPAWNGWSPTVTNTRYQARPGLTLEGVRNLKLKWAFGYDGDVISFSQPTVIGRHIFVGSASGRVHALDAQSGCIRWMFQANGPVRSAIVAVPSVSRYSLLFGDQVGWFYSLEAETGKLRWIKRIDPHESARITASPRVHQNIVYIPVSSWEETRARTPDYKCCTFRGSVLALRISDGSQIWKSYTIAEAAKPAGRDKSGRDAWGPSGASIWSSPTLDEKRSVLYATTGDNFSQPSTPTSDAVIALDLKTGRMLWSKQTTPNDVFNGFCQPRNECEGPDYDFGSSAILEKLANGRDILLAGQKSGIVYALDPDRNGEILWQARVGKGGVNGGVQWGMASDGQKVYAANSDVVRGTVRTDPNDPGPPPYDPNEGGGLTALRISDGQKIWYAPPVPCGARPRCSPSQSAAVTAIPGVVFSGSNDGHLRAYASEDGRILWDFDTVRDFETVNGVRARGGAIDGPGVVVADGLVLVNSGYARTGGMAGNVLLAFSAP
jgi:polyvinyl alcohol dehydrogenase (cytochrome)